MLDRMDPIAGNPAVSLMHRAKVLEEQVGFFFYVSHGCFFGFRFQPSLLHRDIVYFR